MKLNKLFFILFVLSVALLGCSGDEACRQERNSPLMLGMYTVEFNPSSEQYVNIVYTLPLIVTPLDSDSVLYNGRYSTLALPLRRSVTETSFALLDTLSKVSDTITFTYSVFDEFMSLQCGYVPSFDLVDVAITTHQLDSAIIVDPKVTTAQQRNVNIYYRNPSNE